MLLQHLVDADPERLVIVTLVDEVFINAKLCRRDRLALGDPRQIESEFSVMPPHREEFLIVLHCKKKKEKQNATQTLIMDPQRDFFIVHRDSRPSLKGIQL